MLKLVRAPVPITTRSKVSIRYIGSKVWDMLPAKVKGQRLLREFRASFLRCICFNQYCRYGLSDLGVSISFSVLKEKFIRLLIEVSVGM